MARSVIDQLYSFQLLGHRVINFLFCIMFTHHIILPFEPTLGLRLLLWQPLPVVESWDTRSHLFVLLVISFYLLLNVRMGTNTAMGFARK